jgi:putative sigma-54 modulation protein
MISHIDIAGINLELGEDIKKYIRRKVGKLDKYMPRHARVSAHAEVKLRQTKQKTGNKYECEIIMHMPEESVQAKESTMNMFAAVDIVEQKLKNQLVKYKQAHIDHLKEKRPSLLKRLRAKFSGGEPLPPVQ